MAATQPRMYGRASSGNVQRAMWCCAEVGYDVERVDAGLQYGLNNEPWYLKLNPNGRVPLLVEGDFALWESNAIVRYVVERSGRAPFYPADLKVRAIADQWMNWSNTTLGVPFGPLYLGLVRTPPEKRDISRIEALRKDTARVLAILDSRLGETAYVAGPEITMADFSFGYFAHRWFNLPIERPPLKNWENWYARMKERPAYRTHVMLPLT